MRNPQLCLSGKRPIDGISRSLNGELLVGLYNESVEDYTEAHHKNQNDMATKMFVMEERKN